MTENNASDQRIGNDSSVDLQSVRDQIWQSPDAYSTLLTLTRSDAPGGLSAIASGTSGAIEFPPIAGYDSSLPLQLVQHRSAGDLRSDDATSDSLLSLSTDHATVRMNEDGNLELLGVRSTTPDAMFGSVDSTRYFTMQELFDRNGPFVEGEHGTRTFDSNGTLTYTSPDGLYKMVVDRCGKVMSIEYPKGAYRPGERRLGQTNCLS